MADKVFYNGEMIDRDEAKVDMEDRGYQFADGVYEVIAIWEGVPFKLEEHVIRLVKSAEEIDMEVPSKEWFIDKAYNYLKEINFLGGAMEEDSILYMQVTRGSCQRSHAYPDGLEPEILMKANVITPNPKKYYEEGVKAILYPDERWARCYIKSIALLPNVLAKKASHKEEAYEAILVRDGFAMEGAESNLFIVEEGTLITPPASNYILNGITRRTVIDICSENDIPIIEESISRARLLQADEVFVTGTTTEIMPIVQIEGTQIGYGRPGTITLNIQDLYWKRSRS